MTQTNYKTIYKLIESITKSIKKMQKGSIKEDDYLREKIVSLWNELKLHTQRLSNKQINEIKKVK